MTVELKAQLAPTGATAAGRISGMTIDNCLNLNRNRKDLKVLPPLELLAKQQNFQHTDSGAIDECFMIGQKLEGQCAKRFAKLRNNGHFDIDPEPTYGRILRLVKSGDVKQLSPVLDAHVMKDTTALLTPKQECSLTTPWV